MALSNLHSGATPTHVPEDLIAAVADAQAALARTDQELLATVSALQEAVAGILEEVASLHSATGRTPVG
jgi:hypothetical protein